ncbi:hypothetical protein JCM21900_005836 [Sporobolomyces salmonicolor]
MAKGTREAKLKGRAKDRVVVKGRSKTRSDKPKLIEDPEQEEKALTAQLREAGLYAANILGDGNCLFRALSDQLYGSPSMHLQLRAEICDYLVAHAEQYRVFIDEDDYKGGFAGYVREMRQPGTYGTNMELSGFVHRYRRAVKIFQPGLVYVMQVEAEHDEASSPAPSASTSTPPEEPQTEAKLSARERRVRARRENGRSGKGKGKQVEQEGDGGLKPPRRPEAGADAEEGPLCIVYHSWEHYSSLRNLKGPHTGPPRLRIARPDSPAMVEHPSAAASVVPSSSPPSPPTPVEEEEGDGGDDAEAAILEDGDAAIEHLEDVEMSDEAPPPPPPPRTGLEIRRGAHSPPRKSTPLPVGRTALARTANETLPISLSMPTVAVLPSPTSTSSAAHASATTGTRARTRSASLSSQSSSSHGSSPAKPASLSVDPPRKTRMLPRTQSPALTTASSTSSASASASTGSSGDSTGVSSSYAEHEPDVVRRPLPPTTSEASETTSDDELRLGASRRSPGPLPPAKRPSPSPVVAVAVAAPSRRGLTGREKKELARQRRMQRRRDKALVVAEGSGRVLRSGRTTGRGAGGPAEGDGEGEGVLGGKVRELYI